MGSGTLYVMLSASFSDGLAYDRSRSVLKHSCRTRGKIWNTRSVFDGVECGISFFEHKPESIASIAAAHNIPTVCGGMIVAKDLTPETFTSEGEEVSLPPMEINFFLSQADCDRIAALFSSCLELGDGLSLSLSFTDKALATEWSPPGKARPFVKRRVCDHFVRYWPSPQ
ncbi:MAG: hypothetical protein ABSC06_38810 [Rhodopila sp.]|jgi:hypothetical protein